MSEPSDTEDLLAVLRLIAERAGKVILGYYVEAEEIEVRSRSVTNDEAREQLDVIQGEAEARKKERDFEQSHATAMREREARFVKNCEIARENLRILQTNARVKTKDDQGREVYLGEDQLNARTARAQANIEKYCE